MTLWKKSRPAFTALTTAPEVVDAPEMASMVLSPEAPPLLWTNWVTSRLANWSLKAGSSASMPMPGVSVSSVKAMPSTLPSGSRPKDRVRSPS